MVPLFEPATHYTYASNLVCSGVSIMMKCEKCNCNTHVIYITKCDGNVCDKCRVDLVKCRCDDESDPPRTHERTSA
jgi:hypothetical protein